MFRPEIQGFSRGATIRPEWSKRGDRGDRGEQKAGSPYRDNVKRGVIGGSSAGLNNTLQGRLGFLFSPVSPVPPVSQPGYSTSNS
jgi:hypothetical protein